MLARARYALLAAGERDSVEEGFAFRTGRRTGWELRLNLTRLSAGGSIEVSVEAAPTREEEEFVEVYTFGSLSATGSSVVYADDADNPIAVTETDLYIRGRVKAISGTAHFELLADAPFFDLGRDKELVDQELREWEDGFERVVERAEDRLLEYLLRSGRSGRLSEVDINNPTFPAAMRQAIAVQAEHAYRRDKLRQSRDPSQQVTAREMPDLSPESRRLLRRYTASRGVWRGRG